MEWSARSNDGNWWRWRCHAHANATQIKRHRCARRATTRRPWSPCISSALREGKAELLHAIPRQQQRTRVKGVACACTVVTRTCEVYAEEWGEEGRGNRHRETQLNATRSGLAGLQRYLHAGEGNGEATPTQEARSPQRCWEEERARPFGRGTGYYERRGGSVLGAVQLWMLLGTAWACGVYYITRSYRRGVCE